MNNPLPRRGRLPAALCAALFSCALALTGCGNKGPLVLPEDAEPAQAIVAPAPAPAADAAPADAPADTPAPPRG